MTTSNRIGTNVEAVVIGVITAVMFLLVGVALGPIVISTAAKINSTVLTSVTMGSVIITIKAFIPFLFYLGIVVGAISLIWAGVRGR